MTVEQHHRRASSYVSGSSRDGTSHHTSSAFSASAQPDEDWTKISDLAERRRIQNRIAQRNYRKKLKKRLEDLEKKAASSSPSPEQHPAELPHRAERTKAKPRRASSPVSHHRSATKSDDWPMFSNQHTRQISTSPPPPFSFPPMDSFASLPSPPLPASSISYLPSTSLDYPQESSYPFQNFQQPMYDAPSNPHWSKPARQDSILESAISPLNMSGYLSMGPMDFPSAALPNPYADASTTFTDASLTPELCDIYERSSAGSPTDYSAFPQTPMMLPLSPPFSTSFDYM